MKRSKPLRKWHYELLRFVKAYHLYAGLEHAEDPLLCVEVAPVQMRVEEFNGHLDVNFLHFLTDLKNCLLYLEGPVIYFA